MRIENKTAFPVSEITMSLLERKFPDKFFLNVDEIADIVGLSPESIPSALCRGTFPIKPIPHKGRYKQWSIIDTGVWIDEQSHAIINVPIKRRVGRPKSITSGVQAF